MKTKLILALMLSLAGCNSAWEDGFIRYESPAGDDGNSQPEVIDACRLSSAETKVAIVKIESDRGFDTPTCPNPKWSFDSKVYDVSLEEIVHGSVPDNFVLRIPTAGTTPRLEGSKGDTFLVSLRKIDDTYFSFVHLKVSVSVDEVPIEHSDGRVDLPSTLSALRAEVGREPTTCTRPPAHQWSNNEFEEWARGSECEDPGLVIEAEK